MSMIFSGWMRSGQTGELPYTALVVPQLNTGKNVSNL